MKAEIGKMITLLLAITLVPLGGCAPGSVGEGPVAPSPVVTAPATTASVTLTLANESTEAICAVAIAPAGSGDWSADLLAGEVILPGQARAFEVSPGTVDLRAANCFEVTLAEALAVGIFGPTRWRIVGGNR